MALQAGGPVGVENALPVGPLGGPARNRRVVAERAAREPLRGEARPRTGASRVQAGVPGRGEPGVRAAAGGARPRLAAARLVVLFFRERASVAAGVLVEHRRAGDRRVLGRRAGGPEDLV